MPMCAVACSQFLVPMHTSVQVPHAHLSTILLRHVAALNHKHSTICIGIDSITLIGHVPLFQGPHMAQQSRRMHAECMQLNVCHNMPRHILPFFGPTSCSTILKSMPCMQLQSVLVHGVLALMCACARGNGRQVCMCRGQWCPSVHAQGATTPKQIP